MGLQGKASEMCLQELWVYENSQAQNALSGLDPTWSVSNLHLKHLGHLLSCVCKTTTILVPEPKSEIWIACPEFNTCKHRFHTKIVQKGRSGFFSHASETLGLYDQPWESLAGEAGQDRAGTCPEKWGLEFQVREG